MTYVFRRKYYAIVFPSWKVKIDIARRHLVYIRTHIHKLQILTSCVKAFLNRFVVPCVAGIVDFKFFTDCFLTMDSNNVAGAVAYFAVQVEGALVGRLSFSMGDNLKVVFSMAGVCFFWVVFREVVCCKCDGSVSLATFPPKRFTAPTHNSYFRSPKNGNATSFRERRSGTPR